MNYYAYHDFNGDVTAFLGLGESSPTEDVLYIKITEQEFKEYKKSRVGAYVVNGALVPRPAMPSIYHRWNGAAKVWILDEVAQMTEESTNARTIRDKLLTESDWSDTLSAQNRFGSDLYNQWQAYRQALRDVPEQAGFPLSIIWPTPPA